MKKKNKFVALVPIVVGVLIFFFAKLCWQGHDKWDKPFAIVLFISSAMGIFDGIYNLYLEIKDNYINK